MPRTPSTLTLLSLHDALPIWLRDAGRHRLGRRRDLSQRAGATGIRPLRRGGIRDDQLRQADHPELDRKSTRLNSSHTVISYAVFCLKKKNKAPACGHTTKALR